MALSFMTWKNGFKVPGKENFPFSFPLSHSFLAQFSLFFCAVEKGYKNFLRKQ